MKAIFLSLVWAAALTVGPAVGQETVNVAVDEYSFDPAVLPIAVGTTVVWTNVGEILHEVEGYVDAPAGDLEVPTEVSTDPAGAPHVDLEEVEPGDSVAYTFEAAGAYLVNCNLGGEHATMRMLVVVS